MAINNPNYAPTVNQFQLVSASVATAASAAAAQVGPFRGLYFKTTSSVTIIGINGVSLALDAVQKNTMLWVQGDFISAIGTATAVYACV
jgi:hypothetical protein